MRLRYLSSLRVRGMCSQCVNSEFSAGWLVAVSQCVPVCPAKARVTGAMQPRHGAELRGAQRCGSVGSTEVRTLPECRGTLRGAHRGRGTQRCSFLLFVNCSFTHFTHILRFLLTIDIVMVPSSPLEATLLISRKCQVTSFACYKAFQCDFIKT